MEGSGGLARDCANAERRKNNSVRGVKRVTRQKQATPGFDDVTQCDSARCTTYAQLPVGPPTSIYKNRVNGVEQKKESEKKVSDYLSIAKETLARLNSSSEEVGRSEQQDECEATTAYWNEVWADA